MPKHKGDVESDEEDVEEKVRGKRVELLKQKAKPLRCPICGRPARLRQNDGAIICRDGGHITHADGRVWMQGMETTLKELREEGIFLYIDREKSAR